ncbi:MAG: hypothetical protein Q9197_002756, partial [Variospora fuerteventurae]
MVIQLGIIGLSADQSAWASMAHVQAIKPGGPLAHQYKLTALATSKPESAKAAAEFHGVPVEKAYKVPMHKQLAMPALHAKKNVFVEWPLGANLAEAEEMAALAKKQGVKTYVCLQARCQPAFVKVKELVASGALGRIISTTVLGIDSSMIHLPEKARYINDPDSGASMLSVPVTHALDVVLHALASEFSSLSATSTITHPTIAFNSPRGSKSAPEPRTGADNVAITGILTPSGAPLSLHYLVATAATPSTFQWTICGEKASLRMEGASFAVQMMPPKLFMAEVPRGGEQKGIYDSREEGGAGWKEIEVPVLGLGVFGGVAEVYEKIAEGKAEAEGLVGFEEAVVRHRMVEAVERSAKEGKR